MSLLIPFASSSSSTSFVGITNKASFFCSTKTDRSINELKEKQQVIQRKIGELQLKARGGA
jgi:hypothetical protein